MSVPQGVRSTRDIVRARKQEAGKVADKQSTRHHLIKKMWVWIVVLWDLFGSLPKNREAF